VGHVRLDLAVSEDFRSLTPAVEHVHGGGRSVILERRPGKRVSVRAQILGADVGHAVGGANDLDLAPELCAGLAATLWRDTEKETHHGDPNRRNE
jgi:hypothetical protein